MIRATRMERATTLAHHIIRRVSDLLLNGYIGLLLLSVSCIAWFTGNFLFTQIYPVTIFYLIFLIVKYES